MVIPLRRNEIVFVTGVGVDIFRMFRWRSHFCYSNSTAELCFHRNSIRQNAKILINVGKQYAQSYVKLDHLFQSINMWRLAK